MEVIQGTLIAITILMGSTFFFNFCNFLCKRFESHVQEENQKLNQKLEEKQKEIEYLKKDLEETQKIANKLYVKMLEAETNINNEQTK